MVRRLPDFSARQPNVGQPHCLDYWAVEFDSYEGEAFPVSDIVRSQSFVLLEAKNIIPKEPVMLIDGAMVSHLATSAFFARYCIWPTL
jgi:hypothetical protein